jgi:hypothetical protein
MSEELEALKRRVAELEAKLDPKPQAPFVRVPMPRYDFTEAASPPIRLTGREQYKQQSPEEALNEFRKEMTLPTLRPLVPPSEQPPAPVATTIPIGKQPGIDVIDAIALGFAERERREALAQQLDVERKLKGQ